MKVALILVNYNSLRYLPDLFSSLSQIEYPREQCDIFFVDNSSGDGSLEWAREHAPDLNRQIFFIENKTNLGFAAGNNSAIKQALESTVYQYIVLLNTDTIVEPDFLSELVKKAETDARIGAVQSLILLNDQRDRINTSGNRLHYLAFGWSGEYGKLGKQLGADIMSAPFAKLQTLKGCGHDVRTQPPEIGYCSGAAVLYRADVLREIGLLDEKFFMYHEDLELGWRIRLAGYKNVLAPKSIIYHKYEFGRHNKKKWYWTERNRLLVYLTMYKCPTLIILTPVFLFVELGLLVYSLINGWFWYKLRSYGEVGASIPYIIRKRRQVSRLRKVGDQAILHQMAGTFDFPEIKKSVISYIVNPILVVYFWVVRAVVWW